MFVPSSVLVLFYEKLFVPSQLVLGKMEIKCDLKPNKPFTVGQLAWLSRTKLTSHGLLHKGHSDSAAKIQASPTALNLPAQ